MGRSHAWRHGPSESPEALVIGVHVALCEPAQHAEEGDGAPCRCKACAACSRIVQRRSSRAAWGSRASRTARRQGAHLGAAQPFRRRRARCSAPRAPCSGRAAESPAREDVLAPGLSALRRSISCSRSSPCRRAWRRSGTPRRRRGSRLHQAVVAELALADPRDRRVVLEARHVERAGRDAVAAADAGVRVVADDAGVASLVIAYTGQTETQDGSTQCRHGRLMKAKPSFSWSFTAVAVR